MDLFCVAKDFCDRNSRTKRRPVDLERRKNALSAALSVWPGLLKLRRGFLQTRIVRRAAGVPDALPSRRDD